MNFVKNKKLSDVYRERRTTLCLVYKFTYNWIFENHVVVYDADVLDCNFANTCPISVFLDAL